MIGALIDLFWSSPPPRLSSDPFEEITLAEFEHDFVSKITTAAKMRLTDSATPLREEHLYYDMLPVGSPANGHGWIMAHSHFVAYLMRVTFAQTQDPLYSTLEEWTSRFGDHLVTYHDSQMAICIPYIVALCNQHGFPVEPATPVSENDNGLQMPTPNGIKLE